jgi:xanthine dehydrogenase YagS FAD-binding subunit
MRPFAYARATSLDDALSAAREPGTAVLAGGTELLNWLLLGVAAPERLVDITRVAGLDRIEPLTGGGLRIGALARLNDVAADERVERDRPVLREAIHKSASAQIRNLATIGANLLQKTRCAYFRSEDPVPCNRRTAGSGCAARQGHDDRHALFGWTDSCIATQPSDPAVALAALDAHVVTRGVGWGRRIAVTDFHVLPADGVDRDTVLEHGELIEAIELGPPGAALGLCQGARTGVVRVHARIRCGDRAVGWRRSDRKRADRAGLGGHAPLAPDRGRAPDCGPAPDDPAVTRALDVALAQAQPVPGSAYKLAIARGAARRALLTAPSQSSLIPLTATGAKPATHVLRRPPESADPYPDGLGPGRKRRVAG